MLPFFVCDSEEMSGDARRCRRTFAGLSPVVLYRIVWSIAEYCRTICVFDTILEKYC